MRKTFWGITFRPSADQMLHLNFTEVSHDTLGLP